MKQSELTIENYFGPIAKLAAEAGLKMQVSDNLPHTIFFYEEGVEDHVAEIEPDFEYGYGYVRRGADPTVAYFVVSGRFMPLRTARSRHASSPWSCNYTRVVKLEKALEALKVGLKRESPADVVERKASNAIRRWGLDYTYERDHPRIDYLAMGCAQYVRDGGKLPAEIMDDRSKEYVEDAIERIERYIGAWVAYEIITISKEVELKSLDVAP
jgi:hypothetical protein